MTQEYEYRPPVCVSEYVKIVSFTRGSDDPAITFAKISRVTHSNDGSTLAVLSFAPNYRHSSPQDHIIPVTGTHDPDVILLPLSLRNKQGEDYFYRISDEDVPDEIKSRFSH